MNRESVCLNKPIYTGFSVLELSKLLMYEFHYLCIKPKYGDNIRLLFTDTDSLCYHIHTDDVYKDMLVDQRPGSIQATSPMTTFVVKPEQKGYRIDEG